MILALAILGFYLVHLVVMDELREAKRQERAWRASYPPEKFSWEKH